MSRTNTLQNLIAAMSVFAVLFALQTDVKGNAWTGGAAGNNDWTDSGNWDMDSGTGYPGDGSFTTGSLEDQAATVNVNSSVTSGLQSFYWKVWDDPGKATWNINADMTISDELKLCTKATSSNTDINIYNGATFTMPGGNSTIGWKTPDVIFNVENGTFKNSSGVLELSANNTNATIKVKQNGTLDFDNDGGLVLGANASSTRIQDSGSGHGNLLVQGSGGTIDIGQYDGDTLNINGGTLGFDFDSGGATPVNVGISTGNGSDVELTNSNNIAKLDLGWLNDRDPIYGETWTVMNWDGDLLDADTEDSLFGAEVFDKDTLTMNDLVGAGYLGWSSNVTDSDKWDVKFHNTNSGYMTVTAVPEPSSFALLLLGSLALFHRRRRRNS